MNPLNPIFAVIIYSIAFLSAYVINLKYKFTNNNFRYGSVDALRGFLALGVFIHHSAIWNQYLKTGIWKAPQSNFYNHLGQTSVSLFFMITAFLFVSKLLNSKEEIFNWKTLAISRFFRLVPVYGASIIILTIVVFFTSHWVLHVKILTLLKSLFYWGTFTIIDAPLINNSIYTGLINAGVVWSLPYEWLFYFSLPIIGLLILRNKPKIIYLVISALFVCFFILKKDVNIHHVFSFIGGAITPFIKKQQWRNINYESNIFSIVIIVCLGLILFFESSDNVFCKLLIIIVFNLITLGNTVFGLLKSTTLKFLGEMCYSTYLIHGIVIFITMYFVYGIDTAALLPSWQYCLIILIITPLVVFFSFIGYVCIEKPFMNLAKRIIKTNF